MSTRSLLTMRCRIERNGNLTPDAYGQVDAPTWYAHLPAQACYLWQESAQRGEITGPRNADLYTTKLLLPLGVDVTEEDRVNGVTDRRLLAIDETPYNIRAIVRKRDHLLLGLEAVGS